ncbi:hypothetical protein [Flavobacterium sp. GCM10023249]|uniref:hypothetical protein n=1 Tax=unclassified Flavobacterium TaxID=196869 RepID=UPI0036227A13
MLKIGFLSFLVFLSLKTTTAISQNNREKEMYIVLDQDLSSGNELINNGKLHINNEDTYNNEHRYFQENILYTEEIKFNNQVYYNNKIKYDIFKDDLLLNPENQSEKVLVVLNKSKIAYFTIQNRKFVPIQLQKEKPFEYVEENLRTNAFTFYIKYKKTDKEIIQENSLLTSYIQDNSYFIKINNTITEVKSKKSIQNLFPQCKSEINTYYTNYRKLEKENNIKFMENLMLTINKSFKN